MFFYGRKALRVLCMSRIGLSKSYRSNTDGSDQPILFHDYADFPSTNPLHYSVSRGEIHIKQGKL